MDGGLKLEPRIYTFENRLAFSEGRRQDTDIQTIRKMIDGCADVRIPTTQENKKGIDYVATLRHGAELYIDAKARDAGCSRFWKDGPELALEDWSVVADNGNTPKVGWTLDESKLSDLILFTFDPSDADVCYLLCFQLLRIAFRRNYREWKRTYKGAFQNSADWRSHCIFVPASVVMEAIATVSVGFITEKDLELVNV